MKDFSNNYRAVGSFEDPNPHTDYVFYYSKDCDNTISESGDYGKIIFEFGKEYIDKEELLMFIEELKQSPWYGSGDTPYEKNIREKTISVIKDLCISKCEVHCI